MTRISSKHCTLWRKVGRALLTACLGVPLPLGALAEDRSQAISSVTTKLSKAHCRKVGDVLMCKGIAGIGVMVIEGDSRVAVSYGSSARHEPAATLFFGPLNNIADEIEWRVTGTGGRRSPFATILSWRIRPIESARDDRLPELLVVTRMAPGPVCHVAYIDREANPNAAQLARNAADTLARNFDCGKDQVHIIGNRGPSLERIAVNQR